MTFKNILRQAAETAPAGAGYLDVVGITLTLIPIVHRITSMLKSMEPGIQDWLAAETELALAERGVLLELRDELKQNQDVLTEAVRRLSAQINTNQPSNDDPESTDGGDGS